MQRCAENQTAITQCESYEPIFEAQFTGLSYQNAELNPGCWCRQFVIHMAPTASRRYPVQLFGTMIISLLCRRAVKRRRRQGSGGRPVVARASSLHPGVVPRPCQNWQKTTVTSGHPRATRTPANLGKCRLT